MSAIDWFYANEDWAGTDDAIIVSAVMSSVSVLISIWHLYRHLQQYTMPQIQQWIVRIILICPIYAISSAIALKLGPKNGIYIEFARDLYEAFVVYSLLNLIMEYCGGEVDCVYSIENEGPLEMPFPFNCCMKPRARDAKLLRFCQRGVLQFVLIKPIMATCDVITMLTGTYYNDIFQAVEATIYNISYCSALYALLCIYLATRTMLSKFKCLWKISAVKLIILTAYYQGLAVKLLPIDDDAAFNWKCVLLSIEMVFFSMLLACAFPISEFRYGLADHRVFENIKDLFAMQDIVQGFEHNFKPEYKDYALQRSQSEAVETTHIKSLFLSGKDSVAMEMTERYRGRSSRMAFNNLLRGTQPIRAGLRKPQYSPQTPSPYIQRKIRARMGLNSDDNEENEHQHEHDMGSCEDDEYDALANEDGSDPETGLMKYKDHYSNSNNNSNNSLDDLENTVGIGNPLNHHHHQQQQQQHEFGYENNELRIDTRKDGATITKISKSSSREKFNTAPVSAPASVPLPLPNFPIKAIAPPRTAVPYVSPMSELVKSIGNNDADFIGAVGAVVGDSDKNENVSRIEVKPIPLVMETETVIVTEAKAEVDSGNIDDFEIEFEAGNIDFASAPPTVHIETPLYDSEMKEEEEEEEEVEV
jgi:hypothetical protein